MTLAQGESLHVLRSLLKFPLVLLAQWRDARLPKTAHELAIVAIFREEAPFLDEWLTFHTRAGVSHFYLYNNFSTDDFRAVLAPWIARGWVTLYEWPRKVGQLPAYRHCVRRHRQDARWMAFIDIDEFLFSPEGYALGDVLKAYCDLPGVIVYSPYFGSNGYEQRPPRPIVASLTRRAPLTRMTAKTIANPRWIYAIRNVHVFKYRRGEALSTNRQKLDSSNPALEVLRLNHYWSRSLSDLRTKIGRGDASTAIPRDHNWHLAFERELNAEDDFSILPLLGNRGKDAAASGR